MGLHRRVVSASVAVILCAFAPQASTRTLRARGNPSAAAVVQSFYRFHFAHDKTFTRSAITRRRRWLAPELYQLLLAEYSREERESKKHPDEVVFMEGDPFTDTQEHPTSFRIGQSLASGDAATVVVTFTWKNSSTTKHTKVDLVRRGGVWLINNLTPEDNRDLRSDLRDLRKLSDR